MAGPATAGIGYASVSKRSISWLRQTFQVFLLFCAVHGLLAWAELLPGVVAVLRMSEHSDDEFAKPVKARFAFGRASVGSRLFLVEKERCIYNIT
jgi:hypothetical protein